MPTDKIDSPPPAPVAPPAAPDAAADVEMEQAPPATPPPLTPDMSLCSPGSPGGSASTSTKKKKKKGGYRSLMAGLTKGSVRDVSAEKEKIKNVTGGGVFSKVDKI